MSAHGPIPDLDSQTIILYGSFVKSGLSKDLSAKYCSLILGITEFEVKKIIMKWTKIFSTRQNRPTNPLSST